MIGRLPGERSQTRAAALDARTGSSGVASTMRVMNSRVGLVLRFPVRSMLQEHSSDALESLERLRPVPAKPAEVLAGRELEFPSGSPASGSEEPRHSEVSSSGRTTCSDPAGTDVCASVEDAVAPEECSSAAMSARAGSNNRAEWCQSASR